ncbi:NAD-dependent epimerase/dehydratase family protein [Pendulispora rubella]|uniref:NAD-dependent epimerase/dehydratase family protein n=1 Tax=Pendulispora rubella TaxID=2741070 RepID=A0ABZ2L278_9BACT
MNIFVTGASGFIGGSVAASLARDGHTVRGLVRNADKVKALSTVGIQGVVGSLDDRAFLIEQARWADAVINAADSDHRGAVEALIEGLEGSGKVLVHTSGSSIVGDASGGVFSDKIYDEDNLPEPTAHKAPRVAIDRLVLAGKDKGIASAVLCNTLIYGHGLGIGRDSVQLPRLVEHAKKAGVVHHIGPGTNIWSNVHIEDVVDVYKRVLEKKPRGAFMFVESGEASFKDMTDAIGRALGLGPAQPFPVEDAIREWGYEHASYALGSNSRVRGKRARTELGWQPKHTSVIDWISKDLTK